MAESVAVFLFPWKMVDFEPQRFKGICGTLEIQNGYSPVCI